MKLWPVTKYFRVAPSKYTLYSTILFLIFQVQLPANITPRCVTNLLGSHYIEQALSYLISSSVGGNNGFIPHIHITVIACCVVDAKVVASQLAGVKKLLNESETLTNNPRFRSKQNTERPRPNIGELLVSCIFSLCAFSLLQTFKLSLMIVSCFSLGMVVSVTVAYFFLIMTNFPGEGVDMSHNQFIAIFIKHFFV